MTELVAPPSMSDAGEGRTHRRQTVADDLDTSFMAGAFDLLSHLWSRPIEIELENWDRAAQIEEHLRTRLPARRGRLLPPVETTALLDEYERLFVGPGPVLCSPYESFWHEDVPVDIRRSLLGPCTAELRSLYRELGLDLDPSSGELPDHVAVELEAITVSLCEEAGTDVTRSLFQDHLRIWLPRLCRAVRHEAEHPFYEELAATTLDWLSPLGEHLATALAPSAHHLAQQL